MLMFVAILSIPLAAQNSYLSQKGQIRAVVSESGFGSSHMRFYFTYRINEAGTVTEKWLVLPNDRKWSTYSNSVVELTGESTPDGQLTNVEILDNVSTAPSVTAGIYKSVAVPLNIQSTGNNLRRDSVLTITPEQIRDNFSNLPDSLNNFYREASYGMLSFTGVQHPQIDVMPMSISATVTVNCQEQIINEFTPVVRQRLLDNGINTFDGTVDLGVIVFNDTPNCPPYPFSTRGPLGARGVPFWLWIPESWFVTGPRILTHEIGHALGGNHPFVARCPDLEDPQTCTYEDAADRDFMTSGGRYNMLPNNFERRRWGWHPDGVLSEPFSGPFPFYDLRSSALLNVKDGRRQGRYYFGNMSGAYAGWQIYPEARQDHGIFEQYTGADRLYADGITVRYGHSNYTDPDAFSFLIDPNETTTLDDAPLLVGQEISVGGVRIGCVREHTAALGTRMFVE
jgi:hypothetical protein